MARQEKIGLFGQLRPTGIDTSGTQRLQALAGLSSQIGDEIFQRGAKIRQKEGALAGAASVKRDEKGAIQAPTMERGTIFGESFNQAALLSHKAQIEMDNRRELDRLQNEHALDPEAFSVAATALKQGSMTGMPPEIANAVAMDMDVSISNRGAKLTADLFSREKDKQRATALESIETNQDDILNLTRSGDLTEQAELLIKANQDLDGWVATGIVSATEAANIREKTLESIRKQEALRDVETIIFDESLTPSQQLEKGQDFVAKLQRTTLKDINADQRDSIVSSVNQRLNDVARKVSARSAASNGEIKEINAQISRDKANLSAGIKINDQELANRLERASEINQDAGENKIDIQEFRREIEEARLVNRFSVKPRSERNALESQLVAQERSGQLSSESGEILRRIRSANKSINSQLDDKGIEYYQEQGIEDIGRLRMLDESGQFDLDGFTSDLDARKSITISASEHYSRDLSPLTKGEAEQFTRLYDDLDSVGKANMLGAFVTGLGDQSIPALEQMNKKGAGIMALSGAILNDGGDPNLIITGDHLLKEPSNKILLPTDRDAMAGIAEIIGTAFEENTQHKGAVIASVKATYAALSSKAGDFSGIMDTDRMEKAIDVATGGVIEFNDVKIPAPIRGMSEDDFEDMIDDLTPESFSSQDQVMAIDDLGLTIEQIQDNGSFIGIGPGQYLIQIGDGFLVDTDGNEFIIDFRKMM